MNILRQEENGVEFFTVRATGESGMSQSGLARLCGVGSDAINKLLKSVMTSSCPKFLKDLQGMDLTLVTSYHEFKNVTILKDTVCAVILEWYAFESQRPTEKARQAFRQFAAMGIRTWIQSITGWDTSATESSLQLPETTTTSNRPETLHTNSYHLAQLRDRIDQVKRDLLIASKHRHVIHNIVEKPVAVDISLNQIVHAAVHHQASKLNRSLATLELIEENAIALQAIHDSIQQSPQIAQSFAKLAASIEQLRQENSDRARQISHLQEVISQQTILLQCRRRREKRYKQAIADLDLVLAPRIDQITAILMQSQKRTGGMRAIDTCTKRAQIYARYEIGQSMDEIAADTKIPPETVKTYIKLTRKEIKERLRSL